MTRHFLHCRCAFSDLVGLCDSISVHHGNATQRPLWVPWKEEHIKPYASSLALHRPAAYEEIVASTLGDDSDEDKSVGSENENISESADESDSDVSDYVARTRDVDENITIHMEEDCSSQSDYSGDIGGGYSAPDSGTTADNRRSSNPENTLSSIDGKYTAPADCEEVELSDDTDGSDVVSQRQPQRRNGNRNHRMSYMPSPALNPATEAASSDSGSGGGRISNSPRGLGVVQHRKRRRVQRGKVSTTPRRTVATGSSRASRLFQTQRRVARPSIRTAVGPRRPLRSPSPSSSSCPTSEDDHEPAAGVRTRRKRKHTSVPTALTHAGSTTGTPTRNVSDDASDDDGGSDGGNDFLFDSAALQHLSAVENSALCTPHRVFVRSLPDATKAHSPAKDEAVNAQVPCGFSWSGR